MWSAGIRLLKEAEAAGVRTIKGWLCYAVGEEAVLRRGIGLIGTLVVVTTAIAPPAAFLAVGYYYEQESIANDSTNRAALIAYRFDSDETFSWSVLQRQHAPLSRSGLHRTTRTERIVAADGAEIWSGEQPLPPPRIAATAPIVAKGQAQGHVEIAATLRPLLMASGFAALLSSVLAMAAYLLVRAIPLDAPDRTLGQLHEQNRTLAEVLSNVPQGVSKFDAEQRLVVCNNRYAEIYGLPPELVQPGTPLRRILEYRAEHSLLAGQDPDEFIQGRIAYITAKRPVTTVQELVNGRIISGHCEPMPDGSVVITHEDITEREKINSDLRQHKELFDIALNHLPVGLSMFDREHRLIVSNKAYREVYDLPEELLRPGTPFAEFMNYYVKRESGSDDPSETKDVRDWIDGHFAKLASGKPFTDTQHLSNGRTVLARVGPIADGGWVDVLEDITERRQIDAKIAEQKALNEIQRGFFSMASHEFRTPLAIIDSSAQKLKMRAGDIKPNDIVVRAEMIRTSVKRITALMNSVLALAKHDSGHFRLSPTNCDIREVLLDCIRRQTEAGATHKFHVDAAALPDSICADASALDQVFTNLLSNAVKYSPATNPIEIRGWRVENEAVLEFTDHGIGMDEEDVSQLFSRFFRAKTALGIAGTGIGLYVVKILAEQHGGSVAVRSAMGQGTTFTVRLPVSGPGAISTDVVDSVQVSGDEAVDSRAA